MASLEIEPDLKAKIEAAVRADLAASEWSDPEQPPRDWKKVFLVFGLGALSWVATYIGMLELIEANMGPLPLGHQVIIGFSVAMLMVMIVWLLDQMFAPLPFVTRVSYVLGYVFLTLISVGFGFGFYWKVLESRTEASRSAEGAVTQVQSALHAASARLEQLQATLDQLTLISTEKAVVEREKGTSCPNSRPGDGPRRALRDADAARFSFASDFVKGRTTLVKAEMGALDADLVKIASADPSTFDKVTGTRNDFMRALSRKLELTATGFNAFRTDPQLRQIRADLAERGEKTTFPDTKGGTFVCPDPQLQTALRGVVRAIDQLPVLDKPKIATVEGSEAVIEAFRRLAATLQGALVLKLPPSADELRELQKRAVQSVEGGAAAAKVQYAEQGGLSKRDWIPLAIAGFVDLCLLLVSIGRPMNRLQGLVPKMRAAERGPVFKILSRFSDIHADAETRQKFEIFRHVVFDWNGDYYVAVPLDSPRNRNPREVEALQQEAHLLANLFASFEKERIFSRVFNPLLSTGTVQKKLWRQGSKFAASQAFRIYRFRDGAWSEIILGAIMGAARRVEANRLRRAAEDAVSGIAIEAASGAASGPEPTAAGADRYAEGDPMAQTLELDPERGAQSRRRGDPSRADPARVDAALAAAYGPYAEHLSGRPATPQMRQASRSARRWPYRSTERPPGEAEVLFEPANSNTGPSAGAAPAANVVQLHEARQPPQPASRPAAEPARPEASPVHPGAHQQGTADHPVPAALPPSGPAPAGTVDVTLTERTATFTVPTSEAVLPLGMLVARRSPVRRAPGSVAISADPPAKLAASADSAALEAPADGGPGVAVANGQAGSPQWADALAEAIEDVPAEPAAGPAAVGDDIETLARRFASIPGE